MVVAYLRQHTFAQTQHYLTTLEAWAKDQETRIPPDLPPFSQQEDLASARDVYEDLATRVLGLRRAAIEEFKAQVWNRFRERALQHLERLRDHFLKQALAAVLTDLANLQRERGAAQTKLEILRNTCVRERQELINCPRASNVVVVSQGASDSLADDVEHGVAAILHSLSQSGDSDQLRAAFLRSGTAGEYDPLELLGRRQEDLMAQIERAYEAQAQEQATRFQIRSEALHVVKAQLQNLVHFSAPYFEPSPQWRPMPTPQSPNFLFASQAETARQLAEWANEHLQGVKFGTKDSPLGHFVFFYQETPGLALSDLAIAPAAAERLDAEESKPNNPEPTRYTHKLGRRKFDLRAQIGMAQQWICDTLDLAPELFPALQGQPYVSYRTPDGISRDVYLKDDTNVREFIQQNGLDSLIRLLAEGLARLGRDQLVQRMDQRKQQAQTREEREALTKRYEEIIRTVFPPQS